MPPERSRRETIAALGAVLSVACACAGPAAPAREPLAMAATPVSPPSPLTTADPIAAQAAPSPTVRDAPRRLAPSERTQFVLLGLDTTPRAATRGIEEMFTNINGGRDEGLPPATFTVFAGTGALQLDERRSRLTAEELPFRGIAPRHMPVFRYAEDVEEIRATVENLRRLAALGIEIGSHTVRHAHGLGFARDRWELEIADHARILDLVGLPQPVGFRAPFLETNEDLYDVLEAHGFRYDSSDTSSTRRWPTRHPGTNVWVFGVPRIAIPGRERPTIFYDINLEHRLRRAAESAGVAPDDVEAWMDDAYHDAAYAELMRRYEGGRAPFLISGHGGFQRAIGRLMRRVCLLPHVRCATFSEATAYLEAHPELEGAE